MRIYCFVSNDTVVGEITGYNEDLMSLDDEHNALHMTAASMKLLDERLAAHPVIFLHKLSFISLRNRVSTTPEWNRTQCNIIMRPKKLKMPECAT